MVEVLEELAAPALDDEPDARSSYGEPDDRHDRRAAGPGEHLRDEAALLPADAPRFPTADGGTKTSAAWLIEHRVTAMTRETVARAQSDLGVSEATLKRRLRALKGGPDLAVAQ